MMTMLRFNGELWEIALGHDTDENSVNVRKVIKGKDDNAIALGATHIQTNGTGGKTIKAHEVRRLQSTAFRETLNAACKVLPNAVKSTRDDRFVIIDGICEIDTSPQSRSKYTLYVVSESGARHMKMRSDFLSLVFVAVAKHLAGENMVKICDNHNIN